MTTLEQTPANLITSAPASKRRLPRWLPQRWYVHVVLILSVIIIGFPMFYAVLVSTQNNGQVFSYQFTPGSHFLENLDVVLNQRGLLHYMVNSIGISIIFTLAKVVFSLTSGLAFVYFRFPGKWLVFGFVLLTLMLPTDVLIISLFRLVSADLKWGDSYLALVVPFMASATGTFLFRQHFMNIPAELSEAAQLDGANPWQFMMQVLIPISWNVIGALAVIQFVSSWNQFLWPFIVIRKPELQMIQVGLASLAGGSETGDSYGPMMLGTVLASLPPLIVFIALQKQFLSGFALTRDK
ncbi:MAG: carbohydrate ABC transporter permease [Anaerolineae bacterium]|nr:carbohydrate ABC transporter permease [Anaerolineae bacterium]